MVALTGDLHIFASSVTTRFSTVFFSLPYIAQARYVCALGGLLICHYDSVLFRSIFRSLQLSIFDVIPIAQTKPIKSHGIGSSRQFVHVTQTNCIRIAKPPSPLAGLFGVLRRAVKHNEMSGVDGPILRQYLDGLEIVSLLI